MQPLRLLGSGTFGFSPGSCYGRSSVCRRRGSLRSALADGEPDPVVVPVGTHEVVPELGVQIRRLVGVIKRAPELGVLARVAEEAAAVDDVDLHVPGEGAVVVLADSEVPDVDGRSTTRDAITHGQDVLPDPVGHVTLVEGVTDQPEPGGALVVDGDVAVDLRGDAEVHVVDGRRKLLVGIFVLRVLVGGGAGVVRVAVIFLLDHLVGVVAVAGHITVLRRRDGLVAEQAAGGGKAESQQSRTENAHESSMTIALKVSQNETA